MSSCRETFSRVAAAVVVALAGHSAMAQTAFAGIGRVATPQEVAAWDIDVRPDFKGLPKGSGSVAKGQEVWEGKCASCHGVFGESNEVFSPLVGGTTKDDVKTGRVARLNDSSFPGRTTLMKVATVSTLWDYINRAMPWNAPKSLSHEEVYAVTAYLLNMGGVIADGFTLSDANIADVQKLLPNRNGMTTNHGLWPGKGMGNGSKPDVHALACMKDCIAEPKVASFMPDFARNNHGDLSQQQRGVGPQRGADTTRPPAATPAAAAAAVAAVAAGPAPAAATARPAGDNASAAALALAQRYTCTACHGTDKKIVGPGFREIAAKYASRSDAETYLAAKIKSGGQGIWGPIPMPAQTLPEADAKTIAQWLAAGAKK
ncbi:c-type cytochrome [Caenimonas koreensis DSM 17982]|uniref:C-type cytochrome n=1 Tax=Caenimonas koreensis DSM 17982 TaxID=1121255 RepID=A0A844B540_9BURK|nr:c-type cytochrome [Caenimonas koreensis DSM 17982]